MSSSADTTSAAALPDASAFYKTYHGHEPEALRAFAAAMRGGAAGAEGARPLVWLAGDSSLDSKFWLDNQQRAPPCNGVERALSFGAGAGGGAGAGAVPRDVAHSVIAALAARGLRFGCVNAAVEESTLADRAGGRLLPQDAVLRECLRDGDVIVVSAGGNDIALKPSAATAAALALLVGVPGVRALPLLAGLPLLGGGASDAAVADGSAWGMAHLVGMFGAQTRAYVNALLSGPQRARPALVIVCTIYYPLERGAVRGSDAEGWADGALGVLGYDENPARLQSAIRSIYEHATRRVAAEDAAGAPVPVAACPLFEALDPRDARDYERRVEPSARGGEKMAAAFVQLMAEQLARGGGGSGGGAAASGAAP